METKKWLCAEHRKIHTAAWSPECSASFGHSINCWNVIGEPATSLFRYADRIFFVLEKLNQAQFNDIHQSCLFCSHFQIRKSMREILEGMEMIIIIIIIISLTSIFFQDKS